MRKTTFSLALGVTTALTGIGAAPVVLAQDQQQAGSGSGLEEIVVTARRKEEKLQSVPIAITAFSQTDIEQKHIQQISDLFKSVPSLSSAQDNSDANGFYSGQIRLRGLPGSEVYFAEVPLGDVDYNPASGITHGTSTGFFYDLDHLEVDKGPQGTLFGKNSVGGLISIEPKKPTNEYEGYLRVAFGNYSDKEVEGAINVPIIADKLLVRIAGQMQQRDGYTKDIQNGQDLDNRNYYSWRVGVTFRPTDDLENYFLYDGYWQDSNGGATIPTYLNKSFTLAQIPLPGIGNVPLTLANGPGIAALENPATATATYISLLTTQLSGGQPSLSFFPTLPQIFAQQQALGVREVTGRSVQGLGKDYFYGFTNTTTWDLTDDLTIKNIAAARIFKSLSTADDVDNPLPVLNIGFPGNQTGWNDNSVQYTEEFQLQGKALQDKLAWVLGAYLEFDHPLGDTIDASSALGNASYYHFHQDSRSQAVFAHGIYDLGDYVEGLSFSAGYRYTFDYFSLSERGTNGVDAITRGANGAGTNCAEIAIYDANCEASTNAHFSSYGWNLSLNYQFTPGTMFYVRSGNAYRPGGINPQVPPPYQRIEPEHVTDVELGVKSEWDFMGIHARTNADIFHSDYKAIQVTELVQVIDSEGNPHAASLEANAASAYLEGGEMDATFIPIKDVEFSPHASYLYTHYNQYPAAFKINGSAPPFFYDPKWIWGFTATYHVPVDESWGQVAVSATYTFNGQQYVAAPGEDIYPIQPSYDNLDIRADWTNIMGYPVDLGFFMTNATNETHVQAVLPLYNVLGFTSLVYNEPRMFGFSLKYRFSEPGEEPATPAAPYTPPAAQAPMAAPKSYMVFFDFNKSDLTPQAVEIVDTAAKNAGPAKVTQLTVTGHTDTVGSDAYNMRLSKRRAESVAAELEKQGIASSEIEIVAKGKRDLLVPTKDGVKEPQNRRVQIVYDNGMTS
jgi:iron complex outermembrane receptor protein